jgi:hypothetical protein
MNKRIANRLRDRVVDRLTPVQVDEARSAWARAWRSRRTGVTNADQQRARLAMLAAIDDGKTIADAEAIARAELAKEAR